MADTLGPRTSAGETRARHAALTLRIGAGIFPGYPAACLAQVVNRWPCRSREKFPRLTSPKRHDTVSASVRRKSSNSDIPPGPVPKKNPGFQVFFLTLSGRQTRLSRIDSSDRLILGRPPQFVRCASPRNASSVDLGRRVHAARRGRRLLRLILALGSTRQCRRVGREVPRKLRAVAGPCPTSLCHRSWASRIRRRETGGFAMRSSTRLAHVSGRQAKASPAVGPRPDRVRSTFAPNGPVDA